MISECGYCDEERTRAALLLAFADVLDTDEWERLDERERTRFVRARFWYHYEALEEAE
jgi:hypothetical protein